MSDSSTIADPDVASTTTDTESRILHAAESEFVNKGFAGARTTSIAEAAGVTHAMLHYYFRTKEKLFNRIITDKIALVRNMLIDSLKAETDSIDTKIQSIINRHFEFLQSNPGLPLFMVTEIINNPDRFNTLRDKLTRAISPIIDRFQSLLDHHASTGNYHHVDARMILIDLISLNVIPFIMQPMIESVSGLSVDSSFLERRKAENYTTIMRKIKKNQ